MAEIKTEKHGLPLSAIAIAVWAIVLIFAFLANRGSDIGQIRKLFENLGGGPLGGSGIVDSFVGVVVAILIAAAWFGVGSFVISFIKTQRSSFACT